jgi:hypothetical protein
LPEVLNLQPHRGQAKPYEIRQLLSLVERYEPRYRPAIYQVPQ